MIQTSSSSAAPDVPLPRRCTGIGTPGSSARSRPSLCSNDSAQRCTKGPPRRTCGSHGRYGTNANVEKSLLVLARIALRWSTRLRSLGTNVMLACKRTGTACYQTDAAATATLSVLSMTRMARPRTAKSTCRPDGFATATMP